MLHNFNDDGFDFFGRPRYSGGRPPKFTLPERREIKKIALSRPVDHELPVSTWSLSKLAEFLVAEGVVDDISHEGLRWVLREGGRLVSSDQDLQGNRTTPTSRPRRTGSSKLYDIADGKVKAKKGRPHRRASAWTSSGRSNLLPTTGQAVGAQDRHQGRGQRRSDHGAAVAGPPTPASSGVRHLMAAYDLQARTRSTATSR